MTRFEGYSQVCQYDNLGEMGTNERTIRSIAQVALSTSGCIDTQLSRAIPKLDPPQIRTVMGSV